MEPKNTEKALEGRKRLRKCRTPSVEDFGNPNAMVGLKTEVQDEQQEPEETEETEEPKEHREQTEETKAALTSFLKPCAQVSSRPYQH